MSLATSSRSEIQLLSKSPAFAMSLGAKELFHTNFLAFLLESDDPALAPIQLAIRAAMNFPPAGSAVPRCAVWREKNNLDLVVVELQPLLAPSASNAQGVVQAEEDSGDKGKGAAGDWDWSPGSRWKQSGSTGTSGASAGASGATASSCPLLVPTNRVLLIEAKLKSSPSLKQLIVYDKRLAGRGIRLDVSGQPVHVKDGTSVIERRLLSVAGVTLTTPAKWVGVTWASLHTAMSGALATLAGPSAQTVTDYTKALGALTAVIDRVHRMCDHAHGTAGAIPTYGAMRKQALDAQFKSLRISDLLGKTLFDHWLQNHVRTALKKINSPMGWALNRYFDYTNGTPVLGVEFVNGSFSNLGPQPMELRIGVQIQNCDFRLFVEVKAGWSGLESWIAAHPWLLNDWFRTPVFNGPPVGCRGNAVGLSTGSSRATNLKVFNVDRFLYSSRDIDNQSVVDVVNELIRVVGHAASLVPRL